MNKHYQKLLLVLVVCLMSCTPDTIKPASILEEVATASSGGGSASSYTADIVPNQVVIRFSNPAMTLFDKQVIRQNMEDDYHFDILAIDSCDCQTNDLELWTLDTSDSLFIGIEGVLADISENAADDMDGDHQFTFSTEDGGPLSNHTKQLHQQLASLTGDVVRIAIIDTGIDYDFLSTPVLHDARTAGSCQGEVSGWDYNTGKPDPRDDHGHGTVVGKIIIDQLDAASVPYEIMPLKAFNNEGRGSYWNVLCALSYIKRFQYEIDLVNMSFGWSGLEHTTIMNSILTEMDHEVLFIASSGNSGLDTDLSEQAHFPSSYSATNLLSVGGYSGLPSYTHSGHVTDIFRHPNSNYGTISVDIAAPFDSYIVNLTASDGPSYQEHPLGTSYASAFTTARAAELLLTNPFLTPRDLKNAVIASGYASDDLQGFFESGRVLTDIIYD